MLSRVVLFGVFFLGSVAISNAAPLDSPDTVYIDGTPCNSACQAYMAWSHQVLSGRQPQSSPDASGARAARTIAAKPKSAARERAAKQATVSTARTRPDKIARMHPPGASTLPAPAKKPEDTASRAAPAPVTSTASAPSVITPSPDAPSPANPDSVASGPVNPGAVNKPAEQTAGLQQPSVGAPPSATTNPAPPEPTAHASDAGAGTNAVQDQVIAATALAEQLTSSATARPELHAMNGESHTDDASVSTGSSVAASPVVPDSLVALVMSRPEIKSVADLAGKNVAIDGQRSATSNDIRIALVAAGAGEVQLSPSDARAVDRVVDGEVPAAVLTLVSSDAAETFPEIAGYKVFRVPLSPGPSKLDGPR